MRVKNIGNGIHAGIRRGLFRKIKVKPEKDDAFLEKFWLLNVIVSSVENTTRKAIRHYLTTVMNFKQIPPDIAKAKVTTILTIIKKSMQGDVS